MIRKIFFVLAIRLSGKTHAEIACFPAFKEVPGLPVELPAFFRYAWRMPDTQKQYHGEYFYDKNHPVKTFSSLFTHERRNLLLATLLLIIKHSPVWVLPVTTANIINLLAAASGNYITQLVINLAVTAAFILQNIGTHVFYTKYFALTSRKTEARLRNTLIQRLQQ
jgi:hypothetical protein